MLPRQRPAGCILLLSIVAVVLAGCPSATGTGARGVGLQGPQRVYRPERPPVSHYGGRRPGKLSGFERQVLTLLQQTAEQVRQPPPQPDSAANAAARIIGKCLPPKGPPPSVLVEFALRSQGIVDPPPHMVIADVPLGSEPGALTQLNIKFRKVLAGKEYTRVGVALERPEQTPQRRRVVVALLESRVAFEPPVPRALTLGQRSTMVFEVSPTHRQVRLVTTAPDGKITATAMEPRIKNKRTTTLRCNQAGVFQVEITGVGPYGVEVLANFPVYCGRKPPAEVRYATHRALPAKVELMEQDLVERSNQIRRERGLASLRSNAALADVARRHSADMVKSGFVGHVSPVTGRPVDRIRQAKIVYIVIRENVARAYSTAEAMTELMNSPAHRDNIISTDVTEIGVGVVVDRSGSTPVLLVTQLFIKPGKPYNPATAKRDVLRIMRRSRAEVGLPPLKVDQALDRLAADHVKALIKGGGKDSAADARLAAALGRVGARFQQVSGLTVRVNVIDSLKGSEEIKRKRNTHMGLGVGKLDDQILIFILFGVGR